MRMEAVMCVRMMAHSMADNQRNGCMFLQGGKLVDKAAQRVIWNSLTEWKQKPR